MNSSGSSSEGAFADIQHVDELIERIADHNCVPGWVPFKSPLMWAQPHSVFKPAHWQYAKIKPALITAGRVIGTDLAERRNFVLRNPIAGNEFATTRTLVGAYQSILPGEKARSHKHAPHALRVILESRGSYSVVNGLKHPMETGDIVLTPGGYWHGHGHEGSEQAYWFDCLDIPLVHLLEPMTAQEHPNQWESNIQDIQSSPMRIEWKDTVERLNQQSHQASAEDQQFFGTSIDIDAPQMPTIGIKVHRLSKGWAGHAYRHHASSIFVVLAGSGCTEIGSEKFNWAFGDVMAAPMGHRLKHSATEDAVVVELTDEKLMRYCHFYHHEACE